MVSTAGSGMLAAASLEPASAPAIGAVGAVGAVAPASVALASAPAAGSVIGVEACGSAGVSATIGDVTSPVTGAIVAPAALPSDCNLTTWLPRSASCLFFSSSKRCRSATLRSSSETRPCALRSAVSRAMSDSAALAWASLWPEAEVAAPLAPVASRLSFSSSVSVTVCPVLLEASPILPTAASESATGPCASPASPAASASRARYSRQASLLA